MTTEQARALAGAAATGGEGGAEGETSPPTLDELLTREEPVAVADLKALLEARDGEVISRVRSELAEQTRREREAAQQREEANANLKTDIDWALDLERRWLSSDPAEKAAAESEISAQRERYHRGVARAFEMSSQAKMTEAVGEYLDPLFVGIREAGHAALITMLEDTATIQSKYGGNWVQAVIDYGDQRGYERGKAEAADAADRDARLGDAANGAPAIASRGGNRTSATDGVDMKQPGAGMKVLQRALSQRKG